jgi:hypothetical protein
VKVDHRDDTYRDVVEALGELDTVHGDPLDNALKAALSA